MLQITPSRLVAAFTRTSGLASTHITPEVDHWIGVAARGSQARFTRFVGNQPELTSLAPARWPLRRGVTVYSATAPPPCSLNELVSLIPWGSSARATHIPVLACVNLDTVVSTSAKRS